MQHAYWSSSSFLLNITKICLRVSKLWSAQGLVYHFFFRGDNYITNDVSLAQDMPTGPLHPYQILSNYLKSMGVMACTRFRSSGDNYITKTMRVVSLARGMPTGHPLHTYQILSKYVLGYQKLWSALGCVYRRTPC